MSRKKLKKLEMVKQEFQPKILQPKSQGQADYIAAIKRADITICVGPAGSGKTICAVGTAVQLLREGKINRIIFCRPLLGAGEDSGSLPGDMKEKLAPYLIPLFDELRGFASYAEIAEWQNTKPEILEVAPLQFMRGRTFKDGCFIIFDEAQNATMEQMKMILTRLGENSKMVITGDLKQSDLPIKKRGALGHCVERFVRMEDDGLELIHLHMCDVVRHELIPKMMDRLVDL